MKSYVFFFIFWISCKQIGYVELTVLIERYKGIVNNTKFTHTYIEAAKYKYIKMVRIEATNRNNKKSHSCGIHLTYDKNKIHA